MVKSNSVRKLFLRRLFSNVRIALEPYGTVKIELFWDKLEIDVGLVSSYDMQKIKQKLAYIPGIDMILWTVKYRLWGFHDILKKVQEVYAKELEGKRFVVRVRRTGKHEFRSIDLERDIWGGILQNIRGTKVDLHHPQVTVQLEIKDEALYLIRERIPGVWGLPVGVQDRVLSLLSWGFDSGVSSYLMMRRGCMLDYLFFNLGGSAHELGVKQVAYYLSKYFSAGYSARIITVPFESVVKLLVTDIHHKYRGVILKRCMLKCADILAKQGRYYAVVKGDSLGQVSSQTLKNIHVIDQACDTLVLRPLIGNNKQEIINMAKYIWTHNFACQMPEYCGIISDRPSTGARIEDVLEEEKKLPDDWLITVLEARKIEKVAEIIEQAGEIGKRTEVAYLQGEGQVVVDIREPEKVKKHPLNKEVLEVLEVPFYDINHRFKELDQTKEYLLFCDNGVLSNLHALYLQEQGFLNVKIYMPIDKKASGA